jgi:hypothetical protein
MAFRNIEASGDIYRSMCVAAAALSLSVTGCSSDPEPIALPAGALPPGTMEVSIDGQSAGRQHGLGCAQIMSVTTATVDDGHSSVRAVVKSGEELSTISVQFTNVENFSGSYLSNLQGNAKARLVGASTFEVSGVADGFFLDRSAESTKIDFTVRFAC